MPNNPQFSNRLAGEKSPYLLQHARNPVDWYPWGREAFKKASIEGKPILLSVGYSTCHWCHVMAHESFEDEAIAKMINAHFIPVKVDREERPDIDHIYMMATTALTGQGGWPLTVFLTPQGEPFYGGTYFPPYAKWGSPGFADLLQTIASEWEHNRASILSSGCSITEALKRHAQTGSPSKEMEPALLDVAFRHMRGQFDPANAGFGSAPKFPMGHNLSFLLLYHTSSGTQEALDMVEQTLTAMGRGGIHDQLGGGFHRYSTDERWHVPHFEKMLYDQALLSMAYLEGYQATGTLAYEQVARGILDYVLEVMTDKEGGFYSAEDADSLDEPGGHPKEGAFYVFSQLEIEEALGAKQAAVFNYCYGVLQQGNVSFDPHGEFKDKNILYQAHTIEEATEHFHKSLEEVRAILIEAKIKLLAVRGRRSRPYKDDKILCDWNGLMIASFAFAGRVLGDARYIQAGARAADFILSHMRQGRRLLHRWRSGEASSTATLEDYSFFIHGLLGMYEASFEDKYLDAAKDLATGMIEFFADAAGGFFMTASDAEALIIRPKEVYDGALPSGNSVAALVLLKLHALTGNDAWQQRAGILFNCFSGSVAQAPYAYAFLLSAFSWQVHGPWEITFKGGRDDAAVAKMLKVLYKHFMPLKAVKFIETPGSAQVLLCRRGSCQAPIADAAIMEQKLLEKH